MYKLIQIDIPKIVNSDPEGYEFLAQISFKTYDSILDFISFNFLGNEWFDANLCAPLGVLMEELSLRDNKLKFYGINEEIEKLFKGNGFYSLVDNRFVRQVNLFKKIDYRKFHLVDIAAFQMYINESLLYHNDFPKVSELLSKKINKSILEIFNNAHIHGKCEYIYTCGQYFKKVQRLKFTIADMGITIRKNVNNYLKSGSKITGQQAIEWAVVEGNTTKDKNIPGGLGLSLIRDFLKLNGGKIQIISSDGYWEEKDGISFGVPLKNRFLGTIVNLEFNLEDKKSYILVSEIDPTSVF